MKQIQELLSKPIPGLDSLNITFQGVLKIIIIFVVAFLIYRILKIVYKRAQKRGAWDIGQSHALTQITKYMLILIALLAALKSAGVNLNALFIGSAALLVGVGIGLQQTFNDLFSGLIILIEGTIRVDDVIESEGMVGRVRKVGLRTSEIETRDAIIMIIPNSKLTNEKVINWSHNKQATRFHVRVGVAYGSDPEKVREALLHVVDVHPELDERNNPEVRLVDFADSAMIFELLFYTRNMFRIERVKSDVRFHITLEFKKHDIRIPFPQRDIHIRTQGTSFATGE